MGSYLLLTGFIVVSNFALPKHQPISARFERVQQLPLKHV